MLDSKAPEYPEYKKTGHKAPTSSTPLLASLSALVSSNRSQQSGGAARSSSLGWQPIVTRAPAPNFKLFPDERFIPIIDLNLSGLATDCNKRSSQCTSFRGRGKSIIDMPREHKFKEKQAAQTLLAVQGKLGPILRGPTVRPEKVNS